MISRGRSDWLKLLAMLSMLIDHIGVLLLPHIVELRLIGRLAFPIFAFGIAKGMRHSRDRKQYMILLFVVGVFSQIPYMWLSYGARFDPYTINQLWQFLYSALVILVLERGMKSRGRGSKVLLYALTLLLALLPDIVRYYYPQWSFSYGSYGVMMSLLFFLFDGKWGAIAAGYAFLSLYYGYNVAILEQRTEQIRSYLKALTDVQANLSYLSRYGSFWRFEGIFAQSYSAAALPLMAQSERSPGTFRMPKFVAYLFYPLHITLLLLIHFLGVL